MTDEKKDTEKSNPHAILWISVSIFIILVIAGGWAVDYYFAPEMISPTTVQDAVGK